ncbi:MAG: nickel pincer cofactor biosynthesis protein LarB [candidate division Zixibacteria bacterium]|nr:nickel pincer cofactor biosynthesis protein LarB [candidate division Zixibacteria bacterium]MBU1471745.1 nickel pincer cofactor biosynthesis protein LarB [candidate division Zixibacteria bacterium]MBU2625157.1 nickel pincer cofactor biosynthesis protein LarB [candidate division Zixibacteria bacterium]
MNKDFVAELLEKVRSGEMTPDKALKHLKHYPFHDIGIARVDSHRHLRLGFPEVILCDGKSDEQILAITASMIKTKSAILGTRISESAAKKLVKKYPRAKHNRIARTVLIGQPRSVKSNKLHGSVAVITAGTADIPVAEEAVVTCEAMGCNVEKLFDVGVAGIHRLTASAEMFDKFDVFIVVAGMEGALASVVGGMVGKPVIAVPTSIGYGASFGGVAALLSMLNSCSSGVTVVNIDSGFAAASAAVRILSLLGEKK